MPFDANRKPQDTGKSAHELSRHCGIEPPYNPSFVGTVSAFFVLAPTYYALMVPCAHWVWLVVPSVLLLVAIPAWFFVTSSNPVDLYCRANTQTSGDNLKWCNHCVCYTSKDVRTKHCYDCRKCVPGFDHHCTYLQTCIGQHNYPVFFTLLTTVWLWALTMTVSDVLNALPFGTSAVGMPFNSCVASQTRLWYLPLLCVHAVGSCGGFGVVTSLLSFHVMICFKKQTTYEWLVEDIQRKRQREREGYKTPTQRVKLYLASLAAKAKAGGSTKGTSTRTGTKTVGVSAAAPASIGPKEVAIEIKASNGTS